MESILVFNPPRLTPCRRRHAERRGLGRRRHRFGAGA